jgi:hypothetical protein
VKALLAATIGAVIFVADMTADPDISPQLGELCLNRKRHCHETCVALTDKHNWNSDQTDDCNRKCDLVQAICLKQVYRDN